MNAVMGEFGAVNLGAGRRRHGVGEWLAGGPGTRPGRLGEQIASDAVLNEAYRWICRQRQDASRHDDVWILRRRWQEVKARLQADLLAGRYRCGVTRRVRTDVGAFEIWSAEDAVVLKAVTLVLARHLQDVLSRNCYHLAGHGGVKAAVRDVYRAVPNHAFTFRSDAKSDYASVDHQIVYQQLQRYVVDERVLGVVWSYVQRTLCDGGRYELQAWGISRGCLLSPLLAALYLLPLDEQMERMDVFYARFMDDWVVLAPTRWKLRAAIRRANQVLCGLRLEKHPDKTFVGRLGRGFDFLGYRFGAGVLQLAAQTKPRFVQRATRLQERGAATIRIVQYVRHWLTWVRSGTLRLCDAYADVLACSVIWQADAVEDGRQYARDTFPVQLCSRLWSRIKFPVTSLSLGKIG